MLEALLVAAAPVAHLCVSLSPQDNNGVIGLLEPMKTSTTPLLLQLDAPVVKIASGEQRPGMCRVRQVHEAVTTLEGCP